MADTRDLKSLGVTTVRVRAPPPAPLRNDLCMSDGRAGAPISTAKVFLRFRIANTSLVCNSVFILQRLHLLRRSSSQKRNRFRWIAFLFCCGMNPRLAARIDARRGVSSFNPVTASLGHGVVPQTWRFYRAVFRHVKNVRHHRMFPVLPHIYFCLRFCFVCQTIFSAARRLSSCWMQIATPAMMPAETSSIGL